VMVPFCLLVLLDDLLVLLFLLRVDR